MRSVAYDNLARECFGEVARRPRSQGIRAYLGRSAGVRLADTPDQRPMRCDHRCRGRPLRRAEDTGVVADGTVIAQRPAGAPPLPNQ
jgi:hypothetical protein